jgi:DNA-binding LacI/PurR family transcriptional regulator
MEHKVLNHIAKIGYRNVIIPASRFPSSREVEIIDNLKNAFRNREGMNLPLIIELEVSSGNEIDFSQIEKLLRPPNSSEIMIVPNSDMVYSILSTFRRKKIRIPQDIALISMEEGIGFDLLYTPVTCLRKPMAGMALKVANMMWTEVKNAGKSKYKDRLTYPGTYYPTILRYNKLKIIIYNIKFSGADLNFFRIMEKIMLCRMIPVF